MASFSSRQWIAITGGVVLFTALFFINRKAPAKADNGENQSNGHVGQIMGFDSVLIQSQAQIPSIIKVRIDKISGAVSSANPKEQAQLLDSIIHIYDSIGAHIPATYYTEKIAALENSSGFWFEAGDRYYKSAEILNAAARSTILERGITCFANALKIDSNYKDAQVGMGECIVAMGTNPMQGIQMIEGVLKKDSNNEKAQIALGEFSIQSAQYPKAIYRFNKVLKIDPTYIEAYLYLAQAYESSGNKNTAISYLKKYSTFAKDTAIKNQVDNYISKLENDTTSVKNN
jgi:tetratricopeptide (TPR) repeat protein